MDIKKALIIGIVTTGLTAGAIFTTIAIRKRKAKQNNDDDDSDNQQSGGSTTGTTYVAESFPLKKYCKGSNTKKLQAKLGVTADGYFGANTENALYKQYGVKTCSETLFNKIVNGTTSTASTDTTSTTTSSTSSSTTSVTNGNYKTETKDGVQVYSANQGEPTATSLAKAKEIYNATEKYTFGTDEDAIQNVFMNIFSASALSDLKYAFSWYYQQQKKLVGENATLAVNRLQKVLRDELSRADFNYYVNSRLTANGLTTLTYTTTL